MKWILIFVFLAERPLAEFDQQDACETAREQRIAGLVANNSSYGALRSLIVCSSRPQ